MRGVVSTTQYAFCGAALWETMFLGRLIFLQDRELFTMTPGQKRGVRRRDATQDATFSPLDARRAIDRV